MRVALHRVLAEVEPWTGWLASLRFPGYVDDPAIVRRGEGVFRAGDWSAVRQAQVAAALADDESYLRHILGPEGINIVGAVSLAQAFDFARYGSIFELGCGDMAQAYVVHRLHPGIRYVASDLDPWVIEQCARLPALAGIEKRVLDVLTVPEAEAPFAGFDLLVSWGMEYALDDEQLLRLLRTVRRHRLPYLLCSATAAGLGKWLRYRWRARARARLAAQGRLRLSGWERSPLRLRMLAHRAGLRTSAIGRFGYHYCLLFEPAEEAG